MSSLDAVIAALKKDGLYGSPYTPENWTPSIELGVTYPGGAVVSLGNELTPMEAAEDPNVSFNAVRPAPQSCGTELIRLHRRKLELHTLCVPSAVGDDGRRRPELTSRTFAVRDGGPRRPLPVLGVPRYHPALATGRSQGRWGAWLTQNRGFRTRDVATRRARSSAVHWVRPTRLVSFN